MRTNYRVRRAQDIPDWQEADPFGRAACDQDLSIIHRQPHSFLLLSLSHKLRSWAHRLIHRMVLRRQLVEFNFINLLYR
jgi:hypothetical protein